MVPKILECLPILMLEALFFGVILGKKGFKVVTIVLHFNIEVHKDWAPDPFLI